MTISRSLATDHHDQLELAAMHSTPLDLEFEVERVAQRERGTILDVYAADGAEFVRFLTEAGWIELRLDHIISVNAA